jgi:hypothetical protein
VIGVPRKQDWAGQNSETIKYKGIYWEIHELILTLIFLFTLLNYWYNKSVKSIDTLGEKITWSNLEYEHKERSSDWFWALGVIVFTASAAAMIFSNYFFALLILVSGGVLVLLSKREPELVTFELNDKGFKIKDQLYLYQNIKSFWIDKDKYILFVKTERIFMPVITMHIESDMMEKIHDVFTKKGVVEEEMTEHPSEKIMDRLGF